MNKGLLTFMVLVFTTITVGSMFWSTSSRLELIKEISDEQLKKEIDIDNVTKEKDDSLILKEKKNIEDNKGNYNIEEERNDKIDVSEEKNNDITYNDKKEKEIEDAKEYIEGDYSNKDEYDFQGKEETVEVFKVNKHSIPSKIGRKDKMKLLSIAKNLSIIDYGILLEHIKRNDELGAAVDIFKILKDKLDEVDYNKIKEVMDPYINIGLIEENI